jgi:hypothetical protein
MVSIIEHINLQKLAFCRRLGELDATAVPAGRQHQGFNRLTMTAMTGKPLISGHFSQF